MMADLMRWNPVDELQKFTDTFDRLRQRWVSMAEAIGKQRRFDVFVGLIVDDEEKG